MECVWVGILDIFWTNVIIRGCFIITVIVESVQFASVVLTAMYRYMVKRRHIPGLGYRA